MNTKIRRLELLTLVLMVGVALGACASSDLTSHFEGDSATPIRAVATDARHIDATRTSAASARPSHVRTARADVITDTMPSGTSGASTYMVQL